MQFSKKNMLDLKRNKSINEAPITFNVPNLHPQVAHVQQAARPSTFSKMYHNNMMAPAWGSDFLKKAGDYIKKNEGSRNQLYKDSKGKWTIGIGHLVRPEEIEKYKNRKLSQSEIDSLFASDLKSKLQLVQKHIGNSFNQFSDNLKIAVLDGFFRGDLSGSPETIKLLKNKEFNKAAQEYLNNDEYRNAQVRNSGVAARMERNATVMKAER